MISPTRRLYLRRQSGLYPHCHDRSGWAAPYRSENPHDSTGRRAGRRRSMGGIIHDAVGFVVANHAHPERRAGEITRAAGQAGGGYSIHRLLDRRPNGKPDRNTNIVDRRARPARSGSARNKSLRPAVDSALVATERSLDSTSVRKRTDEYGALKGAIRIHCLPSASPEAIRQMRAASARTPSIDAGYCVCPALTHATSWLANSESG